MNREGKEKEGVFRRVMNNKSQSSQRIRPIVSHQSPSLSNKGIKLMKRNIKNFDDVMIPNVRVRKLQIDPKSLRGLLLRNFYTD